MNTPSGSKIEPVLAERGGGTALAAASVAPPIPLRAPEDRRLKAAGLALLAASVPVFFWLDAHRLTTWPPATDAAWHFVLMAVVASNLVAGSFIVLAAGFGHDRALGDARSQRAILLKLLAGNVMVPAVIYAVIVNDQTLSDRFDQSGWATPASMLLLGLYLFAYAFVRRSWRHEVLSADEAMARDSRAPVLYLRSFNDDQAAALDDYGFKVINRVLRLFVWRTPEEELSALLSRIGPVVAIGKPHEPLPELGAARLYVSDAEWQGAVGALMRRAALVVVRVGATPGVLWEIEQALSLLPRERLLLVLIGSEPLAAPVAERLAPVLGPAFAASVPATRGNRYLGLFRPNIRRRLGSVVCFAPGGEAVSESIGHWPPGWATLGYTLILRPAAGPLIRTFGRVFRRLRLPQRRPPRRSRGVAVSYALLLGGVGAHWFYLGQRRKAWICVACCPLLVLTVMWAWWEALRMIWIDRETFDKEFR